MSLSLAKFRERGLALLAAFAFLGMADASGREPGTLLARVRFNGDEAPSGTRVFVFRPGESEHVASGWSGETFKVPPGLYDVRAMLPIGAFGGLEVAQQAVGIRAGEFREVALDGVQKVGALRAFARSAGDRVEEAQLYILPSGSRDLSVGQPLFDGQTTMLPVGTYTVGLQLATPVRTLLSFQDGVKVATDAPANVTLDVGPTAYLSVVVSGAREDEGWSVGLSPGSGFSPAGWVSAFGTYRLPAGRYDLRLEKGGRMFPLVFWHRGVVLGEGDRKVVQVKSPY